MADEDDDEKMTAGEWCGAGCQTLSCLGDGADAACGVLDCLTCNLLVLINARVVSMLAYAVRERPQDPHSAPPRSWPARMAWVLVRAYQLTISAARPRPVCPMTPSCSRYGLEALSRHGLLRGGWLIARRLMRCSRRNAGADPVPA